MTERAFDPYTLVDEHGPLEKQLAKTRIRIHRVPFFRGRRCDVVIQGIEAVTANALRLACMQLVPTVMMRHFYHVKGPSIWPSDTIMNIVRRIPVRFDPFMLQEMSVIQSEQFLNRTNSLLFRLRVPALPSSEWHWDRKTPDSKKRSKASRKHVPILSRALHGLKEALEHIAPIPKELDPPQLVDNDNLPREFLRKVRSVRIRDFKWIPQPGQETWPEPQFAEPETEIMKLGPWDELQIDCYAVRTRGLLGAELKTDETAYPGYVIQRKAYQPEAHASLTTKQKLTLYRSCKGRQGANVPVFNFRLEDEKHRPISELTDIEDLGSRDVQWSIRLRPLLLTWLPRVLVKIVQEYATLDDDDPFQPGTLTGILTTSRPWGCTNCRRCDKVVNIQEQQNTWILTITSNGTYDPVWIWKTGKRLLLEEYKKKVHDPALDHVRPHLDQHEPDPEEV